MSTDTAISVCMEVTRLVDGDRAVYTCSRPAGHLGKCFSVSDPLDDQRSIVHVTDTVIHLRVPEADFASGKTIAYAVRLPSGQWRGTAHHHRGPQAGRAPERRRVRHPGRGRNVAVGRNRLGQEADVMTLFILLSYLASVAVGAAGTWIVMWITEPWRFAKLHEAAYALRAERQNQPVIQYRGTVDEKFLDKFREAIRQADLPTARTAYDADTEQWQQTADVLGFPLDDYTPRRDAC